MKADQPSAGSHANGADAPMNRARARGSFADVRRTHGSSADILRSCSLRFRCSSLWSHGSRPQQERFLRERPDAFERASGAWVRPGRRLQLTAAHPIATATASDGASGDSASRQKPSALRMESAPLLTARSIDEDDPARRVVLISMVCRCCTWMRRTSAA